MAGPAATIQTTIIGQSVIRRCQRCGVPYDWRRSSSTALKMTFCGVLCERAQLGFTIEGLVAALTPPKHTAAA